MSHAVRAVPCTRLPVRAFALLQRQTMIVDHTTLRQSTSNLQLIIFHFSKKYPTSFLVWLYWMIPVKSWHRMMLQFPITGWIFNMVMLTHIHLHMLWSWRLSCCHVLIMVCWPVSETKTADIKQWRCFACITKFERKVWRGNEVFTLKKKTFHTIEFTWLSLLEKHETTSFWCMGFLSPFTTGKVQQANVRIPFIIYELPITSLGCEDINLEWLKTNVSYTRLSHFILLIPPCQSR